MAGERKEKVRRDLFGFDPATVSSIDHVKKLAEGRVKTDTLSLEDYFFSLKRWWCKYYKRPYKDPLLEEYTLEELAFEYYDVNYVERPPENTSDIAAGTSIPQSEWDWAAEEEAKEAAGKLNEAPPDNIENEGLPDDEWADKYMNEEILVNPHPDEASGDITSNFESMNDG